MNDVVFGLLPPEHKGLARGLDGYIWHHCMAVELREYYDAYLAWHDDKCEYDDVLKVSNGWRRISESQKDDWRANWGNRYWEIHTVMEIIAQALSDDQFVYNENDEELRLLIDAILPPLCPNDKGHEVQACEDSRDGWRCHDCGCTIPLPSKYLKFNESQ